MIDQMSHTENSFMKKKWEKCCQEQEGLQILPTQTSKHKGQVMINGKGKYDAECDKDKFLTRVGDKS